MKQAITRASLIRAQAHALAMLVGRPNVTGVDIGPKYVAGKPVGPSIRVHVERKLRGRHLTRSERIPDDFLGVPSDVVTATYQRHGGDPLFPSGRFDTIRPGISIGNPKAKAGTLGLIVYDQAGVPYLLSAHHVLLGQGQSAGLVLQPARFDHGSRATDVVAKVEQGVPPARWGEAGIAKLTGTRPFSPASFGTGVEINKVGEPRENMRVEKTGRTTRTTRGRIEGIGTYFYQGHPSGVDGCRIVPLRDEKNRFDLCGPGDSGAVYYQTGTATGIALHCAGGEDPLLGEMGIACRLSTVLAVLRVSLTH